MEKTVEFIVRINMTVPAECRVENLCLDLPLDCVDVLDASKSNGIVESKGNEYETMEVSEV